jgi:hypothetical protein
LPANWITLPSRRTRLLQLNAWPNSPTRCENAQGQGDIYRIERWKIGYSL